MTREGNVTEANAAQDAVFTLEKIYLKDVSFESPAAPAVFMKNESPQLTIQLGVAHGALDPAQGYHEVVLTVTATAKHQEASAFLVEVQQAGIFRIAGVPDEVRTRTLEIACPTVLLPFAREAVAELISKGGFPPLLISPVNFEALYAQKRSPMNQPAAGTA
jgi:preprotein translocase subunit SecB